MIKFSKLWLGINLIFLGFYLYLIPQVWILLVEEKETLKQDETVYKGLGYISIYEILLVFLIFGKIVYIIFMWYDKIKENEIKAQVQSLEFFCFLPQLINFFLLVAQISYYNGYRFQHKKEFLDIRSFEIYANTKKVLCYLYSIWLIGSFLLFSISILGEGCGYCKCCRDCGIYPYNNNYGINFSYRNNKIYAV